MTEKQTEARRATAAGIDLRPPEDILAMLHRGQVEAAEAVSAALPQLARGARAMADAMRGGGQLVYAGAGASGLQALADGLEIHPTFGLPLERIRTLRAGGLDDIRTPKGHAEDDVALARRDAQVIGAGDCVICLAASGSTPYPVIIMEEARARGAVTIGLSNTAEGRLLEADIPVFLPTPPEVLAGSTRLGAGTSQKIALNMMSTLMGVLLGHVVDGLMVNVVANNEKLFERSERIVMAIADCSRAEAAEALRAQGGAVKAAILAVRGAEDPAALIAQTDGDLRAALARLKG